MDQLTAERREEIGHVLRVERLQPGRGRFRVRQIGAPPLLRAFGGAAKRGRFMGAVARSIDDYFTQQTKIAAR
jgi:hypothetical protein